MPSVDLYGTAIAFLVGTGGGGDVYATVNAETPTLLALGSVTVAREDRGRSQRRSNAPTPTIEVVPVPAPLARWIGIGAKERDLAFDLKVTVRAKDLSPGVNQLALVERITRALVFRYDGVTNLNISDTGVFFRRSSAAVAQVDEVHESSEIVRSVVRLVLTFSEEEADNT